MHEQSPADLHDGGIACGPLAEIARRAPRELVLDPAERRCAEPGLANRIGSQLGVAQAIACFDRGAVELIDAVAARGGIAVGEGGIFARRRVAVIAEEVHRLVVAENDDDLAAGARRFFLQPLQAADDQKRIRPAVGNVAHLHEDCPARGPMASGADQARRAGDRHPRLIVAVEIAHRDDALGLPWSC